MAKNQPDPIKIYRDIAKTIFAKKFQKGVPFCKNRKFSNSIFSLQNPRIRTPCTQKPQKCKKLPRSNPKTRQITTSCSL